MQICMQLTCVQMLKCRARFATTAARKLGYSFTKGHEWGTPLRTQAIWCNNPWKSSTCRLLSLGPKQHARSDHAQASGHAAIDCSLVTSCRTCDQNSDTRCRQTRQSGTTRTFTSSLVSSSEALLSYDTVDGAHTGSSPSLLDW